MKRENLNTPAAIIVAGLIVAAAIYSGGAQGGVNTIKDPEIVQQVASIINNPANIPLPPVTSTDFKLGKTNAPITIVEYSDTECPFCKRFHQTMQLIMKEYDGKVSLVYRHFPLDSLHKKARNEALALECAAAQGGNDIFWKYLDQIMLKTNSNDSLDQALLPQFAEELGLNKVTFEKCMTDGTLAQNVVDDANGGNTVGVNGTPMSVVVGPDGKMYRLEGARAYSVVAGVIEALLQ